MMSLAILCKRSSCDIAAERYDASLAPAESLDDMVDVDVRSISMLSPEKSRPTNDKSLPCVTC